MRRVAQRSVFQRTSPIRSIGQSRAYSTSQHVTSSRTATNWWLGCAVVGSGLVASYLANPVVKADEAKSEEVGWKEKIRGNYNNRIREWSNPEKVFNTFATVTKHGEPHMTIDDFCSAILPYDYRPEGEHTKIKEIPKFIKLADLDKDHLISFGEYLFFVTLLGIPERHFRVAFDMFDLDGNGTLSKEEFKNVMKVLRRESPYASQQRKFNEEVENAGLFTIFFGEDGNQPLTYEQFVDFLKNLKSGVLHLEFERYADETGGLSARNFAMAVVSYAHPAEVGNYLERVNSLAKDKRFEGSISYQEFENFNKALNFLEDIALSIRLYSTAGSVDKALFKRAAHVIAGVELSALQLDVIFHIFDRDGDGKLDQDEVLSVMKQRAERGLSHPRDTGFARVGECVVGCFKKEWERK